MKIIPYIFYLLLVAFYEVILKDMTSIYGVAMGVPVLLAVSVALYKTELTAIWFGFFVGLMVAVARPDVAGWYALAGGALGAATFRVKERLNLDSLVSRLLVVFAGVLVYNVVTVIIDRPDGFFYTIGTSVLPGTVYTTVVAWVFFLFAEGRITAQKVKAMF